ncbi:EF hand, partial [Ancylostoma duodenale]
PPAHCVRPPVVVTNVGFNCEEFFLVFFRFHYFSLNDLNKDNKLDGNEIGKALWHSHGDQQGPVMTDDEIADIVDSALKDMDLNGDGYIDYTEYATKML